VRGCNFEALDYVVCHLIDNVAFTMQEQSRLLSEIAESNVGGPLAVFNSNHHMEPSKSFCLMKSMKKLYRKGCLDHGISPCQAQERNGVAKAAHGG
jgi:hypothetical protein